MAGRLDGKVAIVTGAGSGIGRATALAFAREGASVVVNDIDAEGAGETAAAIGTAAHVELADVTDRAAVDALVESATRTFGRLDVMYNNAGGSMPRPMLEQTDDEYHAIIALNLHAVWYGMRAALRVMLSQGGGSIITTSSGAGLGATPGLSAYGAAKAGLIALSRSVAIEYGAAGIRSNVIAPGPMATPGMMAYLDTVPGGAGPFAAQVPVGRLGTPEEIAEAALFFASDESSYVSGTVLPVDGAIAATLASPKVPDA